MTREGLRRGTLRPRTPLNFSGRSLRSPLLSKNVTDLACFYLHFSQLSLDGPTTLTKGKEKVSDKNQDFFKNKNKSKTNAPGNTVAKSRLFISICTELDWALFFGPKQHLYMTLQATLTID